MMWRLWTRGFGPRDWWHWWRTQGFPMWVAWHLPRRLVYWCVVRVWSQEPADLSLDDFVQWNACPDRRFIDGLRLWDRYHR
jgi:hypothetical protein